MGFAVGVGVLGIVVLMAILFLSWRKWARRSSQNKRDRKKEEEGFLYEHENNASSLLCGENFLHRAVEAKPDLFYSASQRLSNAQVSIHIADKWRGLGNDSEATSALKSASELLHDNEANGEATHKDAATLAKVARRYHEMEKSEKASRHVRKAESVFISHLRSGNVLSDRATLEVIEQIPEVYEASIELGRPEEALKMVSGCIKENRYVKYCLLETADSLLEKGYTEYAKRAVRRLATSKIEEAGFCAALAENAAEMNAPQQAEDLIEEAERLCGQGMLEGDIEDATARKRSSQNPLPGALSDVAKYKRRKEKRDVALGRLAPAYAQLGDLDKAESLVESAPNELMADGKIAYHLKDKAATYLKIADLYEKRSEPRKASKAVENAISQAKYLRKKGKFEVHEWAMFLEYLTSLGDFERLSRIVNGCVLAKRADTSRVGMLVEAAACYVKLGRQSEANELVSKITTLLRKNETYDNDVRGVIEILMPVCLVVGSAGNTTQMLDSLISRSNHSESVAFVKWYCQLGNYGKAEEVVTESISSSSSDLLLMSLAKRSCDLTSKQKRLALAQKASEHVERKRAGWRKARGYVELAETVEWIESGRKSTEKVEISVPVQTLE